MNTISFSITALIFLISTTLHAQKSSVFETSNGAIKGYDPVAYFIDGRAMEGSKEFKYDWKGASWFFSSEENLNTFRVNPGSYAPQYGGYCAYAVSQGYTYRTNPEAWKIVDGKLYLNYSQNIRKKWEANQKEFIKLANENWPNVLK
jgi:YHS domain-containing protein